MNKNTIATVFRCYDPNTLAIAEPFDIPNNGETNRQNGQKVE